LIKDALRTPFKGIGKQEPFKRNLAGVRAGELKMNTA
jgi:Txe/YoeB family toxin of Txe-Axe toxin-antitoxin module